LRARRLGALYLAHGSPRVRAGVEPGHRALDVGDVGVAVGKGRGGAEQRGGRYAGKDQGTHDVSPERHVLLFWKHRARRSVPRRRGGCRSGAAALASPPRRTSMNQYDLKGRIAAVTGGARGIGYAIAERLTQSGARVALWDLDAARAEQAAKALAGAAA